MSDSTDNKNTQNTPIENVEDSKKSTGDKIAEKFSVHKALKLYQNPDSPWTLTQELLQEIVAGYIVADTPTPSLHKLVEILKTEINKRQEYSEELRELLNKSVPSVPAVSAWFKKEGWEEAVWDKIRGDGLFSNAKRAVVIEALRKRAVDKSDVAAKLWLTLSGDYSEKIDVSNDKTIETYREINKVLHNKTEKE